MNSLFPSAPLLALLLFVVSFLGPKNCEGWPAVKRNPPRVDDDWEMLKQVLAPQPLFTKTTDSDWDGEDAFDEFMRGEFVPVEGSGVDSADTLMGDLIKDVVDDKSELRHIMLTYKGEVVQAAAKSLHITTPNGENFHVDLEDCDRLIKMRVLRRTKNVLLLFRPGGSDAEAHVKGKLLRLLSSPAFYLVEGDSPITFRYIAPAARVDVPNDPDYKSQWANFNTHNIAAHVNLEALQDFIKSARLPQTPTPVGIIDSGADVSHTDLVNNLWLNPKEIGGNNIDDDGNGCIDDMHGCDVSGLYKPDFLGITQDSSGEGHGTHVAGIIGASRNNSLGIAGLGILDALKPVPVMINTRTTSGLGTAISALNYLYETGIAVSSNSWGSTSPSPSLESAILSGVLDYDHLFVGAVNNGNGANLSDPTDDFGWNDYPPRFFLPNQINVGSMGVAGNISKTSSVGVNHVHLAAPGDQILSLRPANRYQFLTGTSMATPHVAAAAGLLKSFFPSTNCIRSKRVIIQAARPVPPLEKYTISGSIPDMLRTVQFGVCENAFAAAVDSCGAKDSVNEADLDFWNLAPAYANSLATVCQGADAVLDCIRTTLKNANNPRYCWSRTCDLLDGQCADTVTLAEIQTNITLPSYTTTCSSGSRLMGTSVFVVNMSSWRALGADQTQLRDDLANYLSTSVLPSGSILEYDSVFRNSTVVQMSWRISLYGDQVSVKGDNPVQSANGSRRELRTDFTGVQRLSELDGKLVAFEPCQQGNRCLVD